MGNSQKVAWRISAVTTEEFLKKKHGRFKGESEGIFYENHTTIHRLFSKWKVFDGISEAFCEEFAKEPLKEFSKKTSEKFSRN